MSRPPSPESIAVMHKVPDGASIVSFCVPTRAFRIIDVHSDFRMLRVEQFVAVRGSTRDQIRGDWQPRSTHSDKFPGGALRVAFDAAHKAQAKFIKMVMEKQKAAAEAHGKIMNALGAHNMPQVSK